LIVPCPGTRVEVSDFSCVEVSGIIVMNADWHTTICGKIRELCEHFHLICDLREFVHNIAHLSSVTILVHLSEIIS
jgi:hypothetical protein